MKLSHSVSLVSIFLLFSPASFTQQKTLKKEELYIGVKAIIVLGVEDLVNASIEANRTTRLKHMNETYSRGDGFRVTVSSQAQLADAINNECRQLVKNTTFTDEKERIYVMAFADSMIQASLAGLSFAKVITKKQSDSVRTIMQEERAISGAKRIEGDTRPQVSPKELVKELSERLQADGILNCSFQYGKNKNGKDVIYLTARIVDANAQMLWQNIVEVNTIVLRDKPKDVFVHNKIQKAVVKVFKPLK
ncbi:MAG TPA: hypothetical protein DDW31_07565 [candidate division Zixibacteria bacterium]|nr:hypothetical protein [candidate division Zixibacteria bacterium]